MYDGMFVAKRVQLARDVKNYRDVDLSNHFNVVEGTVQKWFQREFPKRRIPSLALFFKVEEWVFTDPFLPKEDFKAIIFDPKLQSKYKRPDFNRVKGFHSKGTGKTIHTDYFEISGKTISFTAVGWGVKGESISVFHLQRSGLPVPGLQNPKPVTTIEIKTDKKTIPPMEILDTKVIHDFEKGSYRMSAITNNHFSVHIDELMKYV